MIKIENNSFMSRLLPSEFHRLPIGGSIAIGATQAQIATTLTSRNVTANRMNALYRVADGSAGLTTNTVPAELAARNVDTTHMNRLDANISTRSSLTIADITTVLDSRSLDATHLNRLDENVSAAKQKKITTTTGSFTFTSGTSKQTVIELAANNELVEVGLDLSALTTTTTIGVEEKIDGTNYRVVDTSSYPADYDGTSALVSLDGKGRDQKITLTSLGEGADRVVPHARVEELRAV